MWPFARKKPSVSAAPLFFTNTLSGKKELFAPLKPGVVSLYSCGPTVYGPQHIGNMRAALFADTVARVLAAAGYHVRRVINITDVGHLVGDGDEGEDKMAVGARYFLRGSFRLQEVLPIYKMFPCQ
jgi:cysteinyl-tRNA synthetase